MIKLKFLKYGLSDKHGVYVCFRVKPDTQQEEKVEEDKTEGEEIWEEDTAQCNTELVACAAELAEMTRMKNMLSQAFEMMDTSNKDEKTKSEEQVAKLTKKVDRLSTGK